MIDQKNLLHVALADDDDDTRELVAALLRRRGIEVHEACDGAQLLALCASEEIDLVITDVEMPRVRGDEVLRLRRASGDHTPFLIVTGASGFGGSQLKGCDQTALLRKPFSVGALLSAVARALVLSVSSPEGMLGL